jgi:hypothetical protein
MGGGNLRNVGYTIIIVIISKKKETENNVNIKEKLNGSPK